MEKNRDDIHDKKELSIPTLRRLPLYYNIAYNAMKMGGKFISSGEMAACLNVDPTQVRKDIAAIGYGGKPKLGFNTEELVDYLRRYLGFNKKRSIILVGAGNLGIALAKYKGFEEHGMDIEVIFDVDPHKVGAQIAGREILSTAFLESYIKEKNIEIAILTVPAKAAQTVCDKLISYGIKAIWNFAPVNLSHPDSVLIWNHDLIATFITFLQLVPHSAASDSFACVKNSERLCNECGNCGKCSVASENE